MTKRDQENTYKNDKPDSRKRKIFNYQDVTKPVIDKYVKFGKVTHIDATKSVPQVYDETRKAILPECTMLLGPLGSGKTTIGKEMASRTNAKLYDFTEFLSKNGLEG